MERSEIIQRVKDECDGRYSFNNFDFDRIEVGERAQFTDELNVNGWLVVLTILGEITSLERTDATWDTPEMTRGTISVSVKTAEVYDEENDVTLLDETDVTELEQDIDFD